MYISLNKITTTTYIVTHADLLLYFCICSLCIFSHADQHTYTYIYIYEFLYCFCLDLSMQINTAMFEQTGQSGYVLKPRVMFDRTHMLHNRFNPLDKDLEGYQPITLKIHVS